MTAGVVWLEPRLSRGIMACILQAITPLHEPGTGHVRLGETTVGYVPREKSRMVWYFTEHDGVVTWKVTDLRKHGKNFEIPCIYIV